MENKKNILLEFNNEQFPCPVEASVDDAKNEIRSRFDLIGGGLDDATGPLVVGTASIGTTQGALIFKGGRQSVPQGLY